MPSLKSAFIICFTLLLSFTTASGQDKFGAIEGSVSDGTGAMFPAVQVIITNKLTQRVTTASSSAEGTYRAWNLEPGDYTVRFELKGLAPTEFTNVRVLAGRTVKIEAVMRSGSADAKTEITDLVFAADSARTTISRDLGSDQFDRLPNNRNASYFAITTAGVNTGEIEGGIQVNGASGAENNFYFDGLRTNSIIDGRLRQSVPLEYLEQVSIQTAGVAAEHAGAPGGVITAITRTGGNQFHGEAHLYWTGDAISAAPAQRLVLAPDGTTVNYFQDDKTALKQYEPGFSVGGPLLKSRAYLFTAISPRRIQQDQLYRYNNGSQNDSIMRSDTLFSGFTKLAADITPRVRGDFAWLYTPSKSNGTPPAYDGPGPNWLTASKASNDAVRNRGYFQPQSSYTADLNIKLSDRILLHTRGGFFWDDYKDTGFPNITPVRYATPNNLAATGALRGPAGTQNTPVVRFRSHDLTTRTEGEANVSITGEFAGLHNLKAGYSIQKNVNDVLDSYAGGAYVLLYWDQAITFAGRTDRGTYGYYEVHETGRVGSAGAVNAAAYVQDSWNVLPRLNLNIGLRTEKDAVPSFRRSNSSVGIRFGWADRMAPRLAASYDLRGDGRFRVSGGWGRFFDLTKFDLGRNVFGADIWRVYYRSLDNLDVFTLGLLNNPGRNLWPGPNSYEERITPVSDSAAFDSKLKPVSQDQYFGGVDYEVNPRLTVGAQYTHNELRRTIEDLLVRVGGSENYIYANPGEGAATILTGTTGRTAPFEYPKPVRRYDGIQFRLDARMAQGWFGTANYTWSRLWGNYAGLANSDSILTPTTNRAFSVAQQQALSISQAASYANVSFDLDQVLWDSKGHFDVKGPLATDRPHVFKLNGGYEFKTGTQIGGFFYLGSGTPLSTLVWTRDQVPVFVNGRGDRGRTNALNFTDLMLAHVLKLTENQHVRFELNLLNAFNQKTARHSFEYLNRGANGPDATSAIDLSNVDLAGGYDYNALLAQTLNGRARSLDPRFGMNDLFSPGVTGRFAVKYIW